MSRIFLVRIDMVTSAGGAFTVNTPEINGYLHALRYVPHASTPLDTGADITIAGVKTALAVVTMVNIGTSAFEKAPRMPTHDNAGVASLYAAAGEPVEDRFPLAESLSVTVAQGGNVKAGTLWLFIEGLN